MVQHGGLFRNREGPTLAPKRKRAGFLPSTRTRYRKPRVGLKKRQPRSWLQQHLKNLDFGDNTVRQPGIQIFDTC